MNECNCHIKENKSNGNVWLKRLGLLILIGGMFPDVLLTYPEESYNIIKWVVIFAGVAYGISLIKYFIKGFF